MVEYQEAEKAFREILEAYEGEFSREEDRIVFKGTNEEGYEFRARIAKFNDFISVEGEVKGGDCRGFGAPCYKLETIMEEIEYSAKFCKMIRKEATQLKLW